MKNLLLIAISFLSVACTGAGLDPADDAPGSAAAKDIANVSYGANTQQKFDIYLPAGRTAATTKVFIYIHGGGWIVGDKSELNAGMDKIKQTYFPKYAFVTMNYVLAQSGTQNYALPNQINDIQAVMDFIKAKSAEYQVKPEFVLCGSSAGGHLATYYAYTKNNPDVKAVVDMTGPVDLTDPVFAQNPLQGLFTTLVNPASIPQGMNVLQYSSPVNWITNSSVPTIAFYGTTDTTIPVSQRDLLEAKLTQKNVPHETYTYNGDHTGWMAEPTASWMLGKTKAFLDKYNP